jgi:hypothetical protein
VRKQRKSPAEHHLHRYSYHLPVWLGERVRGVASGTRWVRIPLAILLIVGGIFGFLPVLGFWMVPLGLLLLAIDVAFLQRPMVALVLWIEAKWKRWRGKGAG